MAFNVLAALARGGLGVSGWHRDGYLANRVPPLTGSGSAQISSMGTAPDKVLWSTSEMYSTAMEQFIHPTGHT